MTLDGSIRYGPLCNVPFTVYNGFHTIDPSTLHETNLQQPRLLIPLRNRSHCDHFARDMKEKYYRFIKVQQVYLDNCQNEGR